MKHTVIAVFDRHEQARKAAEDLVSSGFDRTDVHVGGGAEAGRAPDAAAAAEPVHVAAGTIMEGGTGVRGRLMDLLSNLFGVDEDDEHRTHYDEAVRRGGTLVSVHAEDEAHAGQARDALLAAGAANIDDRVEEWRKGGWERARTTETVSPDGRSRTVVHRQEASIGGVRVYGHAVAHEYDHYAADFHDDYAARYAGHGDRFEDYEPAYRYGHSLASDERYGGRQWEDIEADVRGDWERRHPDNAWERFKGAVRSAWERATR